MRERLALNIMMLVGQAFRKPGKGIAAEDIASRLNIPAIAMVPIGAALEEAGLLISTEQELLLPGRELSRIKLNDILKVVRQVGETGSHKAPIWSNEINLIGGTIDTAVSSVVGDGSLAELLDKLDDDS
jgi:membrane protein